MNDDVRSNVMPLREGDDQWIEGTPNPDLIKCIEMLLDEAKSGNIGAVAYVAIRYDRRASIGNSMSRLDFTNDLIGRMARLQVEMCHLAEGEDEEG